MPDFTRIFAESGLKNTIGDVEYDGGWDDIVGSNPPSFKDFNSIMNEQDSKLADIAQAGIVDWDANIPYQAGAWARSTVDNAVYELLPGGDPTNEPSANPADWKTATVNSISKNVLKNTRFQINQEGVSGTVVLAANEFGHDMMFGGASGCTYTFSTTDNTTEITISSGSLKQVVEARDIEAGNNILSWSGTAQGRINGGAYGTSGNVSATLTGGSNVVCEWNTGTLSLIQLAKGDSVQLIDHKNYDEQLKDCIFVYRKITKFLGSTAYQIGGTWNHLSSSIAPMRAAPSITVGSGSLAVDFLDGGLNLRQTASPTVSANYIVELDARITS